MDKFTASLGLTKVLDDPTYVGILLLYVQLADLLLRPGLQLQILEPVRQVLVENSQCGAGCPDCGGNICEVSSDVARLAGGHVQWCPSGWWGQTGVEGSTWQETGERPAGRERNRWQVEAV